MILEQKVKPIQFLKGNSKFEFLPTGDVLQFLSGDILINQFLGNTVEGSANNIYLRIYNDEEIDVFPLLGIKSESKFSYNSTKAMWRGTVKEIDYTVTFTLADESTWFWSIDLDGNGEIVDILYAQDISVADKGGTVTNELYMSQYLDHKVISGNNGFVVSSRQNQNQNQDQDQGDKFPYLQQGSLNTNIVGYSTDEMQFFGKEYKITNIPKALKMNLPNINYQFELSYIAMQTEKINIEEKSNVIFYGLFKETHKNAVIEIEFADDIKNAYEKKLCLEEEIVIEVPKIGIKKEFGESLISEEFTTDELNKYFLTRRMQEMNNGKLASFFTNDHSHVVLQEKELQVERPHGNIITTGINEEKISSGLITSTNYMFGIFNAQVVVGNTNLNKLLSTARGLLNILKNTGQRIYVKYNGEFRMLTMPAAYEIGVNYSKWFYKFEDDILTVISYAAKNKSDIILEVKSEKNKSYEFLVTNQLVMGLNEFEQPVNVNRKEEKIIISAMENPCLSNTYPEIHYNINILGTNFELSDDSIFYKDRITRNGTLMTIKTEGVSEFKIVIQGRLTKSDESLENYCLEIEKEKFAKLYKKLTCGFKLSSDKKNDKYDIEKINEIFWWYTHNALIHFAVPHGLEQSGGAAWGTRDVCQGPIEYFMMTQNYKLLKEIIEEIFRHQFFETGEWPQWFMFDKYNMQQDDSHGDVVFWPLKVVGDYIAATGDDSILDKELVYRSFPHGEILNEETILVHIKRSIKSISERFLYDTSLISYGGGDWDDTLQPANKDLREKLVSSWTMALAYQSIGQLGKVIVNKDPEYAQKISKISTDIKDAFNKFLIKDNVIAGFAYCEEGEEIDYMLHPDDKKTGIQYRLLPMTRSIISELVDEKQAKKNVELIEEHLMFPDGVRLMNKPATYKGGVSEFFQRADQAANVGREIGLQYTHAHIRFIEAMAKLGKADDAWKAMFAINPINIKESVKNAGIRQSNSYFSSSDGAFDSRYDFQENFDKLHTGEVEVKGGWRIYSSGPGIYLNQIVSNVLGLRFTAKDIIVDPIIPNELDGLRFDYKYNNKNIAFVYNIKQSGKSIKNIKLNGKNIEFELINNKYRCGGARIDKELLETLSQDNDVVEIFLI
ncbi:MAG: GH36-type glycosyl hydrolase domain-containing protein [Clostridium sp.]|uniref:GH36-type glycosyl hydrolase domain-containing protein n=1 Tax=Clostridium sp. TaxID=1506 RepID=UPI003D6C8B2F